MIYFANENARNVFEFCIDDLNKNNTTSLHLFDDKNIVASTEQHCYFILKFKLRKNKRVIHPNSNVVLQFHLTGMFIGVSRIGKGIVVCGNWLPCPYRMFATHNGVDNYLVSSNRNDILEAL